ncbi:MAG: HAMP domain-containing histidine kinase [Lachnospiraceae bacterium]|nr:HAMP domain-containing histidine kinase [Lachnospiraceae bacterium]
MKKRLYLKFIGAYVLLAVVELLVITSLGRQLIFDELIKNRAEALYAEAGRMAKQKDLVLFRDQSETENAFRNLQLIASASKCAIRLLDREGREIINTSAPLDLEDPNIIENFDYAAFGPKYYEVSRFFGQYEEDVLSVIYPITQGLSTRGYLAVSVPITSIQEEISGLMKPFLIVGIVNFFLSFSILLFFGFYVYYPLGEIITAAKAFASGDLSHKIDIPNHDEMGYLADTLNVMAAELKKNEEYQKTFISNVSHDFRSPLTSIKGFTEAMTDGTIPPELHERYLGIIAQETERLEKLTKSVMTLENMDMNKAVLCKSDFDINSVLKNTAEFFEGSCRKKKISINLVLTGRTLMVHADKEKIEQVIYNLLDNAIKFSEKNSEIKLETTLRHGKCEISVKDEGCGIPENEQNLIYDRFFKSDSSRGRDRKGSGLGLSIVKEIIAAHGQTIRVVSTENVGTEFVFTLDPV